MGNIRNYRMDNIKFFMILGVVLEHSLLVYGYPRSFEIFWAIAISWLMPMFTIISGFFFKEKTIVKYRDKYIYPFLLFSAVNFIIGYFFYSAYHEKLHIVGYAMWYLWALFVFAVITPPTIKTVQHDSTNYVEWGCDDCLPNYAPIVSSHFRPSCIPL